MKFIIICGPTACGKTALALDLARERKVRIINADAIQIYRDIPIITAQPTQAEQQQVEHRLYGFKAGDENFSVNSWIELALAEIDETIAAGYLPILVGGTGMYIKMLTRGFKDLPHLSEAEKLAIEQEISQLGLQAIYTKLCALDPAYLVKLNQNDKHRIIRAYGLLKYHGLNAAAIDATPNKKFFAKSDYKIFYLRKDRSALYAKSDNRVVEMLENGAIAEVETANMQYPNSAILAKAIGYQEIVSYLNGASDFQSMLQLFQQNTRHFIKRQYTWFNNQLEEHIALTEANVKEILKNL